MKEYRKTHKRIMSEEEKEKHKLANINRITIFKYIDNEISRYRDMKIIRYSNTEFMFRSQSQKRYGQLGFATPYADDASDHRKRCGVSRCSRPGLSRYRPIRTRHPLRCRGS